MDFIPVGLYFINEVGQETVEEAWRGEQRSEAALRDMGKGADEGEWKVAALLKPTRVKTLYLQNLLPASAGLSEPAGGVAGERDRQLLHHRPCVRCLILLIWFIPPNSPVHLDFTGK